MKKTWCLKLTGVVRVRVCEKGVAECEVVNQSHVLEPVCLENSWMKELNNHDEIFVSEDWLQMKQGKKLIDKLLNAAVVQVEDQIGESHGIEYKDFAEKD